MKLIKGINLFFLISSQLRLVSEPIYKKIIKPDPCCYYDYNWFTKIESGKSVSGKIILRGYPQLPQGYYYCSFSFNNPYNINRGNRIVSDGRFWIGPTRSELIGFNLVDSGKVNSKAITMQKVDQVEFFNTIPRRR